MFRRPRRRLSGPLVAGYVCRHSPCRCKAHEAGTWRARVHESRLMPAASDRSLRAFFCSGDGGWWLRTPACTHMGRAPQHAAATSCKRTGPNAVYDWRQRPRSPRDLYPTGAKVRSSDAHETFQPIRRAHRHVCGRYPRAVHQAIVAPGRARAANCHAF